MSAKFVLSVFIFSAIYVSCYGNFTYRRTHNDALVEIVSGKNCTRAGFMCDDCHNSYSCHQLSNGTWVKELVETCGGSKTCQSSTGICSTSPNHLCKAKFVCAEAGLFPDPVDCTKYHICASFNNSTLEHYPQSCSEGLAYDPLRMLCSGSALNCSLPVPGCTGNSTGVVERNRRMYYRCTATEDNDGGTLYVPRFYYCPPDHKMINGTCHDKYKDYGMLNTWWCAVTGRLYCADCRVFNLCIQYGAAAAPISCADYNYFDYTQNTCLKMTCDTLYI